MSADDASAASSAAFKSRFSHYANEESLPDLLREFAASQNVGAVVSERVAGVVSGRFDNVDPRLFLDQMAKAQGLIWFFDGSVIYFYRSDEIVAQVVKLEHADPARLTQTLKGLDLFDPRYQLRVAPAERMIYVSGPARYVELVSQTAQILEVDAARAVKGEEVIRVFPLKYAWADDLAFKVMDREINVPGVASILRNMQAGKAPSGAPAGKQEKLLPQNVESLRGKGLAKSRAAQPGQDGQAEGGGKPQASGADGGQEPPTQGNILADSRLNAVVVRDLKEKMPYYEDVIRTLDAPAGLVEISAAILDVSTDASSELGVDWRLKTGDKFKTDIGFHAVPTSVAKGSSTSVQDFTPSNTDLGVGKGLSLSTTILGGSGEYFLSRIRALEDKGDARVVSRPSVLTINNVEALLEQNQTFYVKVPGYQNSDLFNVTAGILLKVTPHVIEEDGRRKIKLVVSIEDGSIQDATVDSIPIVKRSSLNTQAVIGAEESLLIGGYFYTEKSNGVAKVPVLGDIPVLGYLFKTKSVTDKKMERLFLITPRIINRDGSMAAATVENGDARLASAPPPSSDMIKAMASETVPPPPAETPRSLYENSMAPHVGAVASSPSVAKSDAASGRALYSLRLGSFPDQKSAAEAGRKLIIKGFTPDVLWLKGEDGRIWYVVQYGAYQTREDAGIAASAFRKLDGATAEIVSMDAGLVAERRVSL